MTGWFDPEKKSIEQLRQGRLEGLHWIYRTYSQRILNQCYRILLSKEQAEEASVRLLRQMIQARAAKGSTYCG